MQFRTHLAAAAATALVLYPRSPRKAAALIIGGVILDVDHFVLYALRSGDWNPLGALQYNKRRQRRVRPGDTRPRYGSLRSFAHRKRLALPFLWLLDREQPALRPLLLGIALHLALDTPFWLAYDWRVWRRAHGRCERCGTTEKPRHVCYRVPPRRGGARWALHNRALWCEPCAWAVWNGADPRQPAHWATNE